jgi:hypothetical protein
MASVPSGEQRFTRPPQDAVRRERSSGAMWLLLVPLVGTLLPWIYNTRDPELIGIPFFYWYQMLWVPLSVVFTIIAYRATTTRGRR